MTRLFLSTVLVLATLGGAHAERSALKKHVDLQALAQSCSGRSGCVKSVKLVDFAQSHFLASEQGSMKAEIARAMYEKFLKTFADMYPKAWAKRKYFEVYEPKYEAKWHPKNF